MRNFCNVTIKKLSIEIFTFSFIIVALFFRNPLVFMFPAPLSEDFGVFIAQEYNTGFPANAFVAYQGYLHLLPRIITWIAMKFDLSSVMTIMNWTVLFIKAL